MTRLRPIIRPVLLFAALLVVATAYTLTTAQNATVPKHNPITVDNLSALKQLSVIDHSVSVIPRGDSGTPTPTPYGTSRFVEHIEFSPDGHFLAHFMDKVLWLTDLRSGSQRALLLGNLYAPSFSPDWNTFAAAEQTSDDVSRLYLWDTQALLPATDVPPLTSTACTLTVTASSINLRRGPSAQFDALGYAYRDDVLPVLAVGAAEGWVEVKTEVGLAWVTTRTGKMAGDCASLPLFLSSSQARTSVKSNGNVGSYRFTPDSQRVMIPAYGNIEFWSAKSGHIAYSVKTDPYDHGNQRFKSLTFSADSRYMTDNTGYVWDVATGKTVINIWAIYPNTTTNAATFSPDSQQMATAGEDGTIRIWDIATGQQTSLFYADHAPALSVEFSADGRWLAAASGSTDTSDQKLQIWDMTTGEQIANLDCTGIPQFSSDNATIIFTTKTDLKSDGSFRFAIQSWDLNTRTPGILLVGPYLTRAVFKPDGTIFFMDKAVLSLKADLRQGPLDIVTSDWSLAAQLTEDNKIILYGVPEGTVPVIASSTPTATLTSRPTWTGLPADMGPTITPTPTPPFPTRTHEPVLPVMRTPTSTPQPLGTLPPAPTVTALPGAAPITADTLTQMRLLTTYSFRPIGPVEPGTFFNFDGSLLFTIQDTTVSIHDAVTGAVQAIINVPVIADKRGRSSVSAAFAPDGKTLATVASDSTMRFWDVTTGEQTGMFTLQMPDAQSSFTLSQPYFNASGADLMVGIINSKFAFVDAQTGKILVESVNRDVVNTLPDGSLVTLGTKGLTRGGRTVIPLQGHRDNYGNYYNSQHALPNVDWSILAIYDSNNVQIELWDTVSATRRATLRAHTTHIMNVTFSGNGRVLASLDRSKTLVLWDVETGKALQTFTLSSESDPSLIQYTYPIALNQDGSVLIFTDEAGTIHLVNGLTGKEELRLPTSAPSDCQRRLMFSPDASTLVSFTCTLATFYGVPTEQRTVFAAIAVLINPESINVRQKPSSDSPVIAQAKRGFAIASGRDKSGRFVYLEAYGGWVNAGSTYIDPGALDLNQLPIRPT